MKFFTTLLKVFIAVVFCAAIAIPAAYFMANAKYYTPEKRLVAKASRAEFEHNHPDCKHYKKDGVEYLDCEKCGAWMTIIKNTVSGEHGNHSCAAVSRKNNRRMGLDELLYAMVEGKPTPHDFVKTCNEDHSVCWRCEKCGLTIEYRGDGFNINSAKVEDEVLRCPKE